MNPARRLPLPALISIAFAIVACSAAPAESQGGSGTGSPGPSPIPGGPESSSPGPSGLQPAASASIPADLLERMVSDFAATEKVGPADVQVVATQDVQWPDGSLGCPQPGMFYNQMITPGYRVELRAGDAVGDYRAARSGTFVRCQDGSSSPGAGVARPSG